MFKIQIQNRFWTKSFFVKVWIWSWVLNAIDCKSESRIILSHKFLDFFGKVNIFSEARFYMRLMLESTKETTMKMLISCYKRKSVLIFYHLSEIVITSRYSQNFCNWKKFFVKNISFFFNILWACKLFWWKKENIGILQIWNVSHSEKKLQLSSTIKNLWIRLVSTLSRLKDAGSDI